MLNQGIEPGYWTIARIMTAPFRPVERDTVVVAMTFSGAFDDSNSHKDAPLILWAGFAAFENQWALLDEKWRAILEREQLPYFHMVACQERRKPFENWKDPNGARRDALIHDLRQAIFQSGLFGIACGVPHAQWDEVVTPDMERWVGAPGTVCLTILQASTIDRAKKLGWTAPITTIYDKGVAPDALESIGWTNSVINEGQNRQDRVGILPVQTTPALQAADLFAWELQNDMKNYLKLGPDRPIRPHFKPWWDDQNHRWDVQFLEADVVRDRLAHPDFQKVLNDKVWNADGSARSTPATA